MIISVLCGQDEEAAPLSTGLVKSWLSLFHCKTMKKIKDKIEEMHHSLKEMLLHNNSRLKNLPGNLVLWKDKGMNKRCRGRRKKILNQSDKNINLRKSRR